jgi:signal transduction histidine kinase
VRALFLRIYLTVGVAALATALGMITIASLPRFLREREGRHEPPGHLAQPGIEGRPDRAGPGGVGPRHGHRPRRPHWRRLSADDATVFVAEAARRLRAGEPPHRVFEEARPWVGDNLHLRPRDRLRLDPEELATLEQGGVVVHGPPHRREALALVPLRDSVVVGLLPLGEPTPIGGHILGTILLMAFAAFGLGLALWPLRRQLLRLSDTAERFIAGDLGARVEVSGEDAMQDIAKAFNGMAARSQELLARHRELLQSVSHEMRTPVARMLFTLDLLENEPDAKSRASILAEMRSTTTEMSKLTEELLEFYRLEPGTPALHMKPVDLAELVDDVASRWEGAQVVRPNAPAMVRGDERLLFRAIDNLASNAVRYAGAPTLRLEVDPSAPGWIVHVDDTGEGIPSECRERVFEPFVRLEGSRSRTTGGSGLGLSIVQRITQLHGGTVRIDQSPAGGCRVSMRLPAGS